MAQDKSAPAGQRGVAASCLTDTKFGRLMACTPAFGSMNLSLQHQRLPLDPVVVVLIEVVVPLRV